MAVSYAKYRKLLKEIDMSASRLGRKADIAPNTMTRLQKDEVVSLDVLGRLCKVLNCNFGDLVDYVPEKDKEE
ncbi:MAG: helix-turn-helix transcriptional regulator [Dialister sp.]|nr:helix-turn-helix transcriptional regulator [Dialister sp.]